MKKSSVIIIILAVLLVLAAAILVYGYFKGTELNSRINQLENDRTQISKDKDDVVAQLERCRTQSQIDNSKLNMIMEDWGKMQKTCATNNVCRGKFAFMRYTCNAQGDAVDNGDKICQCDQNCNLQVL